jgi:DNA-binding IclR family transcriptional regulator
VEPIEGIYRLGGASFRLASAILARRRFPEVAMPTLQQLVEVTGESALIATLSEDGRDLVYVAKIESPKSLRFAASIGNRRPLYCMAAGMAMLGFQRPALTAAYVRSVKLKPLTPNTKSTKSALLAAIARARRDGFAVSVGEAAEGVTGIAAPIFGQEGLAASLFVAMPTTRVGGNQARIVQAVRSAAQAISRILGGDADQVDVAASSGAKAGIRLRRMLPRQAPIPERNPDSRGSRRLKKQNTR